MIDLSLTKPQARLILKALDGPSVDDPKAAELYHLVQRLLAESVPTAPWRVVVDAVGEVAYRGNGCATNLVLACGHRVRMHDATAREIKRSLTAGVAMKRRCHECGKAKP
jgi:hypothetical protein